MWFNRWNACASKTFTVKQQCEEAIRRLEGEDGMAEAVPLPQK